MKSLREREQEQLLEAEVAQKHNAMINENYRKLENAVSMQTKEREAEKLAEETAREHVVEEQAPLYISPSNVATFEQMPRMTEYVSPTAAALFTPQKFNAIKDYQEEMVAPAPVEIVTPKMAQETAMEAQYALTPLAKVIMAVFTFVVIAMLSLICINTQIIRQKSVRIQNLEEKKEQLLEEYDDLQRRIEAAQSEEAIRAYADANGIVLSGN